MDTRNGEGPANRSDNNTIVPSHNDLLQRIGALAEGLTAVLLAPYKLTPAQTRVLDAVHRLGPNAPMADIASATAFPLGAVPAILDRLFLRHLIVRTDTSGPGGQFTCSLTPTGHDLIQTLGNARTVLYSRLLDGLNDDELVLLDRLASSMENNIASPPVLPEAPEERIEPESRPVLRLVRRDDR